jgi:hypothetical protein
VGVLAYSLCLDDIMPIKHIKELSKHWDQPQSIGIDQRRTVYKELGQLSALLCSLLGLWDG